MDFLYFSSRFPQCLHRYETIQIHANGCVYNCSIFLLTPMIGPLAKLAKMFKFKAILSKEIQIAIRLLSNMFSCSLGLHSPQNSKKWLVQI